MTRNLSEGLWLILSIIMYILETHDVYSTFQLSGIHKRLVGIYLWLLGIKVFNLSGSILIPVIRFRCLRIRDLGSIVPILRFLVFRIRDGLLWDHCWLKVAWQKIGRFLLLTIDQNLQSVVWVDDGGVDVRQLVAGRNRRILKMMLHIFPSCWVFVPENEVDFVGGSTLVWTKHDGVRRLIVEVIGCPACLLQLQTAFYTTLDCVQGHLICLNSNNCLSATCKPYLLCYFCICPIMYEHTESTSSEGWTCTKGLISLNNAGFGPGRHLVNPWGLIRANNTYLWLQKLQVCTTALKPILQPQIVLQYQSAILGINLLGKVSSYAVFLCFLTY